MAIDPEGAAPAVTDAELAELLALHADHNLWAALHHARAEVARLTKLDEAFRAKLRREGYPCRTRDEVDADAALIPLLAHVSQLIEASKKANTCASLPDAVRELCREAVRPSWLDPDPAPPDPDQCPNCGHNKNRAKELSDAHQTLDLLSVPRIVGTCTASARVRWLHAARILLDRAEAAAEHNIWGNDSRRSQPLVENVVDGVDA